MSAPLTHSRSWPWPNTGHHLIVGPPQSGKTTAAVSAFVDFVRTHGPDRAVFLTPTRQRAAHLQNVIARDFGGTTGAVLVRTPASLAFGLLRQAALAQGQPVPTLITGPEQDHILAELIAGHLADGAGPTWPEDITPEVLSMRAFRDELRDLLMRAAEAGLDGQGLAAVGRQQGRPEWVAAGELLTEYTAVTVLGETTPDRGARYDAATILDRAARVVAEDPGLAAFDALVHDDYQDATLATSRLLGRLAEHGAQLLLTANPDTAVQGFRGGLPALSSTATHPVGSAEGAFGAQVHTLPEVHMNPAVWARLEPVAADIPPIVGGARRRPAATTAAAAGAGEVDAVTTVVLPSVAGEAAFIARHLRELHVLAGRGWAEMAVIVRGHHQLSRLRRSLTHAGVPVQVSGAEVALREEPAVVALLTALAVSTRPEGPTLEETTTLLLSAFGSLDALGLRRLRRTLRQIDPTRSSAELLLECMADERLRTASGNHPGLHRVARMLEAGREAVRNSAEVDMVLWRIWHAAGVASTWQEKALTPGPGAARADGDLDAVVALFTVAEQFTTRRAGADPRAFIEYLTAQDFPADTLAARSRRAEAVSLHTAASAAGAHWPIVVVAGVQEDTWPDLRIRDTLLGASDLADLATARHREGASGSAALRDARREVAADERRMFLAACSRAQEALIVTAVLDTDTRPSMFFERLTDALPDPTHVPPPLDLRGLVGKLRAEAVNDDGDPARRQAATSLLTELTERGVQEADQRLWHPAWSGQGQVLGGDEKVVLNPSAIEVVLTCPLRWFLTTHGGRVAQTRAQNLGTLIHDIAKNHPRGGYEELRAELAARWGELDLPDNHIGAAVRERAEGMISQLAAYLASHDAPAEVEVDFEVDVGPAKIRGQVDRVEYRAGGPHIVDFKTGSSAIARGEEDQHPQLGAYQLAAAHGAFGRVPEATAGASLVYLAVNKNVLVREQPPLAQSPDPGWALAMVEEAAQIVTADHFPARPSPACSHCPVRSSCPAIDDGARLGTER